MRCWFSTKSTVELTYGHCCNRQQINRKERVKYISLYIKNRCKLQIEQINFLFLRFSRL